MTKEQVLKIKELQEDIDSLEVVVKVIKSTVVDDRHPIRDYKGLTLTMSRNDIVLHKYISNEALIEIINTVENELKNTLDVLKTDMDSYILSKPCN